eukprot:COSAG02_NODE_8634_length_2498_cov_2.638599_1_plen_69_part_10
MSQVNTIQDAVDDAQVRILVVAAEEVQELHSQVTMIIPVALSMLRQWLCPGECRSFTTGRCFGRGRSTA